MIKKRIAVFCMLTVSLALCLCFLWQSGDEEHEPAPSAEGEPQSVGSVLGETGSEDEKYYMHIEGETLFAYRLYGEKKTLLKQAAVNPAFLPEDELEMLREGIYANSYEEICLYLESYVS